MIYCPVCKKKMNIYNNNYYSCEHNDYEVIIALTSIYEEDICYKIFDSISFILSLPGRKVYEIYMYISDDDKRTIIYNYEFYPNNIFNIEVGETRKIMRCDGFLINNYDYDKIVSKLNMVLNFQ